MATKPLTRGLFFETASQPLVTPVYTFSKFDKTDSNGKHLRSFGKAYLELCLIDPTEYTMANTLLDGWSHWQNILKSAKCLPFIEELRKERDVMLESEVMKHAVKSVKQDDKNAPQSARTLLKFIEPVKEPKDKGKAISQVKTKKIPDQTKLDAERLGIPLPK